MWALLGVTASICFAITAYIDEYLTRNNPAHSAQSIHARIGPIVLTSLISNICTVITIWLTFGLPNGESQYLLQAFLSGIPTMLVLIVYLYLLDRYSVALVIPLFQLTSIWLMLIGLFSYEPISLLGCIGVLLAVCGAYVLDSTHKNGRLPSLLLTVMLINTAIWACTLVWITYLAKMLDSMLSVIFLQSACAFVMGCFLYISMREYRQGMKMRLAHKKISFISLSIINELFSQFGYALKYFTIALAPVAAYGNVMSGLENILLILIFTLFPVAASRITMKQILGILTISLGVVFLELSTQNSLFQ